MPAFPRSVKIVPDYQLVTKSTVAASRHARAGTEGGAGIGYRKEGTHAVGRTGGILRPHPGASQSDMDVKALPYTDRPPDT